MTYDIQKRKGAIRKVLLDSANDTFQYGILDCMQFTAAVIKEITGRDLSEGFDYDSIQSADDIINKYGSLGALGDKLAGTPVSVDQLTIGDPVLMNLPKIGETMGIFMGNGVMAKTENGTVTMTLKYCVKGWAL